MFSFWIKFISLLLKYNVCVGLVVFYLNFMIIDGESCFLIVLIEGYFRKIIIKYICIDKCVCVCINIVKWFYSVCMI